MKPAIFLFAFVLVASITHDAQAGIAGNVREKRSQEFWQGLHNGIVQFRQGVRNGVQAFFHVPQTAPSGPPFTTPHSNVNVDDILNSLNPDTPHSEVDDLLNSLSFSSTAASTPRPVSAPSDSNSEVDDLLNSLNSDDSRFSKSMITFVI